MPNALDGHDHYTPMITTYWIRSGSPIGLLCISTLACVQPATLTDGYASRAAFTLTPEGNGLRGRISLLEDARIRPAMRDAIRESYGEDVCSLDPPEAVLRELCAELQHRPLKPALLRVVDASNRIVVSEEQQRPIAELAAARLYGDAQTTYLVTVDLSAGAGSYSGPLTRLAEVRDRSLRWLAFHDAVAGKTDTIHLVSTLKTAWRLVPRTSGPGQDILQIACRPDFDASAAAGTELAFVITFERYTFIGGRWVRHTRQEPGFWENEGDESFPARSRFP